MEISNKYKLTLAGCLITGLILIVIALALQYDNTRDILTGIFYGLGISLITSTLIKSLMIWFDYRYWQSYNKEHIGIFGKRRNECGEKYSSENKKVEESLEILCVSAVSALSEIKARGNLYDALTTNNSADIKILVANPNSESARKRAMQDNPGNADEGLANIVNQFCEIEEIYELLKEQLKDKPSFGTLEIRVTDEYLNITIYNRDNKKLVYGQYFDAERGDNFAAFTVEEEWHPEVFRQYRDHFTAMWGNDSKNVVLRICSTPPVPEKFYFNKTLFDNICANAKNA